MKKILIQYLWIALILSFLIISVKADHFETEGEVYWQEIPALCGTPNKIQAFIDHKEMKPYHISLGREASSPDGEPVFMVTYYVNEKTDESMSVLDIPSGAERCILYHTFNLTKTLN